jgi:hypothetical protein
MSGWKPSVRKPAQTTTFTYKRKMQFRDCILV